MMGKENWTWISQKYEGRGNHIGWEMETPTQANMNWGRITGEVHCKGKGLLTRWMKSQSVCQTRTCTSRNLHAALKAKRFLNDRRKKPLLLVLGSASSHSCLCRSRESLLLSLLPLGPSSVQANTEDGRWKYTPFPGLPHWLGKGNQWEGLQHLELELNGGQLRKKGISGEEISAKLFFPLPHLELSIVYHSLCWQALRRANDLSLWLVGSLPKVPLLPSQQPEPATCF